MRVLVVEDEPRLAENVAKALREGPQYAVDLAHDGEEARLLWETHDYDGVVLDLMLPKQSGADVLKSMRAKGVTTPVLVLTAVNETMRVIELLNLGADGYMSKPFDLGELIARIGALIRRSKGTCEPVLRFGEILIHIAEHRVSVGGSDLEFSPTERRILEYLMFRPRVVVSSRELSEHLFDFTWASHSNVVEVHISNMRRKLRKTNSGATIENIRGCGYRLRNVAV